MSYKSIYFFFFFLAFSLLTQCSPKNSSSNSFPSISSEDKLIADLYFKKDLNSLISKYDLDNAINIKNHYSRFLLAKAHYYHFSSQVNLNIQDQQKSAHNIKLLFQSLLTENPLFLENYLYLARLDYYFLNNTESALLNLEKGLHIESDNLKLLTLLFNIYEKTSNLEMSKKIAQNIIFYQPIIIKAQLTLKKNQ